MPTEIAEIKDLLKELIQTQKETADKFKETDAAFKASQIEREKRSIETDVIFKETDERFKETDANYNIYGAVAFLNEADSSSRFAENQQLFVIKATGDSASIVNALDFQPRVF